MRGLHGGAGDETRTHDPQLGRLMLYQLSYARTSLLSGRTFGSSFDLVGVIGIEPIQSETPDLQSGPALQLRRTPSVSYCGQLPPAGLESQ